MMYKRFSSARVLAYAIIAAQIVFSNTKPLTPEDVKDLLPPTPQTVNETLAAIVQDPVVKDAVQNAVGNGSLSGLVVKKKVAIMPAKEPDKVLAQRHQILVVPDVHLEDVRKNITEENETEDGTTGFDLSGDASTAQDENEIYNEYTTERNEITTLPAVRGSMLLTKLQEDEGNLQNVPPVDTKVKTEIEFPESTQTIQLPNEISVPIVAIVDPPKDNSKSVDSPLVAVIPPQSRKDSDLANQLDFFTANREEIRDRVQKRVDQMSLTVDPKVWRPSTQAQDAKFLSSKEAVIWTSTTENQEDILPENSFLAPEIVDPREAVAPILWSEAEGVVNYPKEDMDVAEDIIFRPLFRYRQEAQQRSRYREPVDDYRRSSYRRYGYGSHSRRYNRYDSRYSGDYY